jgi:hypothetical protein
VAAFILGIVSRCKTRMSTDIYNFTCVTEWVSEFFSFKEWAVAPFYFFTETIYVYTMYNLCKHTVYIPDVHETSTKFQVVIHLLILNGKCFIDRGRYLNCCAVQESLLT